MSDNQAPKGYSYHEMSNKVEQADRRLLRARAHEPTGEVESLRGRTDIGRMGDRVGGGDGGGPDDDDAAAAAAAAAKRPPELEEHYQRRQRKKQKSGKGGNEAAAPKKERTAVAGISAGGQTILDLDNLTGYQPTTSLARAAYESLLVRYVFPCDAKYC